MHRSRVARSPAWLAVLVLLCWQSALASSPIDAVFARLAARSRSASKASTTTTSAAPAADPRRSRKQQRGGSSLSLSPEEVDDALRMLGFHPEHQAAPLSDIIPSRSTNLRRGLQTTPSPTSVAGYLQISYHTTNNCNDLDPVVMVLGYGQCIQASSGSSFGSYATVFSLPESGPLVVSNLTTTYKDAFCSTPVSTTPSDPVPLVVDASGNGITLESCVPLPPSTAMGASPTAAAAGTTATSATSASAPAGTVSYQIESLSSYLPHVGTEGVATVSFPTPAQCTGVRTLPIGQLAPLKLVYQSCVQVVVATTLAPLVSAVWARYDVQGSDEAQTTDVLSVSCYSDRTCSTSAACPAAITPTWAANKLYVSSAGAAPMACPTSPDASAQYTVACLYDPDAVDASKCVPYNGPAEVPIADAPLIENYLKARFYTGDDTCKGDFVTIVMAFGQCDRNYDGIPRVRSSTTSLTVNQQSSLEATITYFSDDVCGKKNQVGKPFTTLFAASGSTSQVGKCFVPEVVTEAEPTSFFLEGLYDDLPALDFDGISYTGFQSKDQCAQQQTNSITYLLLQRIGGCQTIPGSSGGSYMSTCNSTAIISQYFSDPACQAPLPVGGTVTNFMPPFMYTPLGSSTCSFQGDMEDFSMNSDANLYTSASCYTAPVVKTKKAFVINAALIAGCTVALFLVICSIGACCWYQNIYMPSKALAEQEEHQQDYRQDYPDQPLPQPKRASTAIVGGSDGSEDLARYRSAQPQLRREDQEGAQEEQQHHHHHQQQGEGSEEYAYDDNASRVPTLATEASGSGAAARGSVKRLSTKGKRVSSSGGGGGGGSSYSEHDEGGM